MGPACGALGLALAFALVWHIWWMAILAFLGVVTTMIMYGFARDTTRIVSAQEVGRQQRHWLEVVASANAIARDDETHSANQGLAEQAIAGAIA